MSHTKRVTPELSSGAMADIAFLLLIFYMVTTEIKEYKGLTLMLPQQPKDQEVIQKNDRNMFAIRINSSDQFMVEGKEVPSLKGVRDAIKKFVLNYKKDPTLSDDPVEAVVSIKTDRNTSYKSFIEALDEAQAAYYEIYAERVGLTAEQFRRLRTNSERENAIYTKAKNGIPMNISIAESN